MIITVSLELSRGCDTRSRLLLSLVLCALAKKDEDRCALAKGEESWRGERVGLRWNHTGGLRSTPEQMKNLIPQNMHLTVSSI